MASGSEPDSTPACPAHRHPRFIATVPGQGYRFIPTFSNTGWDRGQLPGETKPQAPRAGA
jgi:DNA-binding winged helix-turn-helix (wHTH) protein